MSEQLGTNLAEVGTDCISRQAIDKFVDGLEEIFADLRERHVDDSVCGLCEYDGAYIGQSGNWCNECPGFDKDDCFKLSDKTRKEWTEEIIKALPPAQPEQHLDEWCDSCKEYDKKRHSCPRWNKVIKNTVDELKSAQPVSCEDAVSRKDCLKALSNMMDTDGFRNGWAVSRANVECMLKSMPPVTPKQHIDADGTLWVTVTDIGRVTRVIVDEDKSKFCRQFYMDAKPEQRTDLLKAEIKRMKRSFTICINRDYYTGYMSALSAVEGYIAQLEGANNDT